eukprot:COSAG05_NODE_467_length_9529_cov_27.560976_5_plen_157_part_00
MGHIWTPVYLSKGIKLRLYATYVVSVLSSGIQAWPFGEKERKKLQQWNAKMMVKLVGVGEDGDLGAAVRAQHRDPEVDIVGILRPRRLKWLGHVLRMPEDKLICRVMLRHEAPYPAGSMQANEAVPEHESLAELVELAGNHETPEGTRWCADTSVS